MSEDIKFLLFIIVAAVLSAVLRFKMIARFCLGVFSGFLMGCVFFRLSAYWIPDEIMRAGFIGIIIMWCHPLHEKMNAWINNRVSDVLYNLMHDDNWQ